VTKFFQPILLLVFSIFFATPNAILYADTTVLPSGVRAFVYKHIEANISSSFDKQGVESSFQIKERLGSSVIKSISSDAASAYDELHKIDSALAESVDLGTIDLDPEITASANIFALGWGLSDSIMVIGALPVMKANVTLRGGYTNTGAISSAAKQLKSIQDSRQAKASAFAQVLEQLPSIRGEYLQGALVNDLGYKPIGSWSGTGIGDAIVYTQWRFVNKDTYKQGAKFGMELPTGAVDDPDNLVDIPFGSGYYATYVESLHDFNLWRNIFSLSFTGRYQYQWPTTRTYRLAPSVDFPLTAVKENIHYKPGNYYSAGAEFGTKLFQSIGANIGYSIRVKNKDKIPGKDPNYDYGILESKTDTIIRKAEVSVSYSTVNLYTRGKFPVPFKIGSTYNKVLSGMNTERISQVSLDFEMYF